MEYIDVNKGIMVLDTRQHSFDLKQIRNRRFMYSSKHHTLILGEADAGRRITGTLGKRIIAHLQKRVKTCCTTYKFICTVGRMAVSLQQN